MAALTTPDRGFIIIVSGLPRSGTSLMMGMLQAGGLPVLTDSIRQADEDNPRGYFEYEIVKKLDADKTWMAAAHGKAVKIISALLIKLPPDYPYRIIFMRRNIQEILASQRQMLIRRGQPDDSAKDSDFAVLFERHLQQVAQWLTRQANMSVLYVDYGQLVGAPIEHVHTINTFIGGWLDEDKMIGVIDPKLHRQRR